MALPGSLRHIFFSTLSYASMHAGHILDETILFAVKSLLCSWVTSAQLLYSRKTAHLHLHRGFYWKRGPEYLVQGCCTAPSRYLLESLLALFQQEQPEAPEEKAESVPDEPVEEAKLSSDSSVQTS